MKIIARGKISSQHYRGNCHYCRTHFECERGELEFEKDKPGWPDNPVCRCPVCNQVVYMTEIPE